MQGVGIRSLLFVPGDNEKMIRKAILSPADAVIIDLEDAVDPGRKSYARALVKNVLADMERGEKPIIVRLNAFDTGHTALDAVTAVQARAWGVMLPKWQGDDETLRLAHFLEALEIREDSGGQATRILTVATETALAVLALSQSRTRVNDRLWGMLWGGEDLSATIGAQANRDEEGEYTHAFRHARSMCLYAASAEGAVAIDAVVPDLRDAAALERETRAALRDGFSAKAAIHPAQVEIINRVMTPTEAQLAWSREVVRLLESTAVARLDGKMVDLAHKRIALRLLARADAIRRAICV